MSLHVYRVPTTGNPRPEKKRTPSSTVVLVRRGVKRLSREFDYIMLALRWRFFDDVGRGGLALEAPLFLLRREGDDGC